MHTTRNWSFLGILSTVLTATAAAAETAPGSARPSVERRAELQKKMLERFHRNHDDILNDEERKAIPQRRKRGRARRHARIGRGHGVGPRFDPNKARTLSPGQRSELRASREARALERLDTNGDGVLSDEERAARSRRHRRGRPVPRGVLLPRFDTDQDGVLSEEERAAAREAHQNRFLERFDSDGDGVLSRDEKKMVRSGRSGRGRRRRCRGRCGRSSAEG